MKPNLTLLSKRIAVLTLSFLMLLLSAQTQAQLGVYSFTGVGACPNQNPVINAQPANATFSNFSAVGASCYGTTNVFATFLLNSASTINLGQYYTFTVTAAPNNVLDLDSLKFDTYAGIDAPNAKWHLRSNLDNYATDIAADSNSINAYTTKAILSNTTFLNIPNVTFRLYVTDMNALSSWGIDEVKLYGKTIALPAIPSNNISSNAPQCASSGVIITSNILPPAGEHWYWQTSATGISTTNGTNTYTVNTSGTYYLRAQDDATLLWSSGASSITVTVTPLVGTPVFTNGLTSTRCQAAGSLNVYQSTAPNGTGGTRAYSLDNASLSAGLTISNGGAVSYPATWVGDSYITVTYTSCDGSTTSATHTTTTTAVASSPTFALGTTSTKCIGAAVIQYSAAAANTSGITYSMSSSGSGTNPSISASTGVVTYAANFNGTVIITATGIGCNGTVTSTHTVTTAPNVAVPIFSLSTTSSRCFGAGVVTYTATATNSTSVVYNLDAASITAGNTIVATTGEVTYTATWGAAHLDSSIITATALGCSGPAISTHKAISKPAVSVPVFAASASTRCQGGNLVTYIATASNYTTLRYTLDATTAAFAGNSINSITGVVAYAANWSGTTIITATAQGCNGPQIATHTVTTTPTVGTPIFSTSSLTRCQGAGVESYTASATNSTSISYSLSPAGAGTINAVTGAVTYTSIWSGVATITATAIGCNGPKNSTYIVTSTPTVGTPIFSLGLESVRDQIIETITYNATATNNTGITYSLDPASLSAGNTINASTGAVTWSANWFGVSSIIASANGCNGPVTSSHIVNINAVVVQTPLYLSTPSQTLDRIDPVATNITTTVTSNSISSTSPGITLDANSTGTGLVGPIYVSHTTGTGRNRLMLVSISNKNRTVLSVTYGSTPLILVGENNVSANARVAIYKLINPPSGLNTVTVNFSANPTSGAVVNVSTYTGVDLINPLGSFVSNEKSISTTGTSPNVNVSTTSGDLVYDVVSALSATVSVGAGQTQRFNNNSGSQNEGAGSSKLASTTSTTISWTTSSTNWAIGAVAIKPEIIPNNISFTQSPALCSNLIIKAQTVQVLVYANVISGIMPVNPAITASLKYGTTTFVSLSNPVYNSSSKVLSWTGTLPADVTVPSGQAIELNIASAQAGVEFQIDYHSATKPSRISLLPVSTFIDIISFDVFNAPYPGGIKRISGNVNTTYYVRAKVATPFGYKDITGLTVNIIPSASNATATCVDSTSCTRTYEYAWTTLPTTGTYDLLATAREGYENLIKNSDLEIFDVCTLCPPIAAVDSATGGGGAPIVVDILANDYDPNNNIKVATLSIPIQSNNGTGYIANGKIIYLPNGTFAGKDTLTYQICDSTGLCATSKVYFTINPTIIDICSESTKPHIYFIPYPEQDAFTALTASSSTALPSSNIRTVISITLPYPNMTVVWDQWEDGYELNSLNPLQATTKVWGDGNPYNGIAPGYSNDIIPAGGSIILDNTMPANPRVATNFFYDGKDKITASGQIAVTQVCGEPTNMPVQAIKTNVTSTFDYGRSFTVPLGENFASQDFKYTALFVRAEHDNTTVQVDKDNDGTLETTFTLNQGQSYLVNGGVKYGATLASNNNIGVELNSGGVDGFSIRNASIFPATWYSNVYYTPVSTSDNAGDSPKDTSVVMFYNSLSRPISVNWSSGVPASGTITLPAKTSVRFPLAYSTTAAYKFVNPTGEAFTAIEIVDSYTPGGGGNDGQTYDWSFNLIAESRLTDFATTAWAPGGLDLVAPAGPDVNGNPIWVTPNANTTVYVKWDGKVSGSAGSISPCGLKYDVSYNVNALNYIKLRDPNDNDQSGIAIFTCNGAKLAAVYGEDPEGSTTGIGIAYWDVGTTILPFCKQKLLLANDDYARTIINQPVTIPILLNDFGFLAVVDPSTVTTAGLLQPSHGSVTINPNGTMIYTPSTGYTGKDTLEYNVCSTGSPVVCDKATVYIDISTCPAPFNENVLAGKVFLDKNDDGINNDGGTGVAGAKVYLYIDGNCSGTINANELKDSITVDASGTYQFITYPEKSVADDFDGVAGARTCANGTDGNAAWLSDWTDIGDPSTGFCNTTQSVANTDAEIVKDGAFTNAIRLKDNNVSVTRTVNLSGAAYAFLSFSYRRKSASLTAGKDIIVQASSNGTSFGTVFTIAGDGNTDANYVTIYNQDITAFAGPTTYIRFLTNNNVADADTVYIDNVKIQYISYPICYITKLDATTIPIYHHTTTILQHNMTATGSQTCLAPYDFGIAKNHLTISGTLFRDANGLTDNKVNGTPIGLVEGNTMYAYLSDSTGTVVNRTTVNATTGNYVFTNADVITNYTLQVSSMSVNVGDIPPTDIGLFSLTDNWVNTGDTYGKNNIAGTGIKPGTASGSVSVSTLTSNIDSVNVAIETLPDSYNKTLSYPFNQVGVQYDITGGLTGTDQEDGILGAGKTYKITELPIGAVLYYNGIEAQLNQVITLFNPTLLVIDPDDRTSFTSFKFASRDAAGLYDPTPAIVTISWSSVLPIKLISFNGRLNGSEVDLNWITESEINTKHFEVERSGDGANFIKIGTVQAKGNSSNAANYDLTDYAPLSNINYYRLKIVNNDGSFEYSRIVVIRIGNNAQLATKVSPNPFINKVDIDLTLTHNTTVDIRIVDVAGKVVLTKSVKGLKGSNIFTLNDLEKLQSALYMLHVVTDDTHLVEKLIKK